MKLLPMKTLLQFANQKEIAIAAINISSTETIKAVMEAAEIISITVILQSCTCSA